MRGYQQIDVICRGLPMNQTGDEHDLRPHPMEDIGACQGIIERVDLNAGEHFEFEQVRRHDVGTRHCFGTQELCNSGRDVDTVPHVPNHRVTAVFGPRVGTLYARDSVDDRSADFAIAHVAAQDAVAVLQLAAFLDPLHDVAHHRAGEHGAAPVAVAGMVGELDRMDRPYVDPQPL